MRRRTRPAYTLLEVLLALVIAVMLMAALYGAIGYQLRAAQEGRDLTQQTTLSRTISARIENDIQSIIGLADAGRFRLQNSSSGGGGGGGSGAGGGGGTSGAGGAGATPATTTPSTSTPASGSGTPAGGSGGSGGTGGTGGTSGTSASTTPAIVLPMGVMGDSSNLTLFVSKPPSEAWPAQDGSGSQLVSDLRRVDYWLAGGQGLCRQEQRVITSQDVLNQAAPTGDPAQYLLAAEVRDVTFRYFDGSSWQTSWDSTTMGADGVTPIGSPRAIEVRLGVLPPRSISSDSKEPELKYYRHVVFIPTANGATQANNGTTVNGQSTSGGGTSP